MGMEQATGCLQAWDLLFFDSSPWAMRGYFMGLTDKRIVFIPLRRLTTRPTDDASELLLGRVTEMGYKKVGLNGTLTLAYGNNIRRTSVISRQEHQNAEKFLEIFNLLPKPALTEQEREIALAAEAAYKREIENRIIQTVVFSIIIVIVAIFVWIGIPLLRALWGG
jgi:hypothetical protein